MNKRGFANPAFQESYRIIQNKMKYFDKTIISLEMVPALIFR